ncbi:MULTISPECIES: hypothetical protein [unclassified Solwaraspora]|uniref:hypothetical protein n=1 Tax=unclassified Solwaraspora TaxID=2627926 RepID=UPI00248B20E6|nr:MULTISPECIES: hypothetical protein [unclassified Solwaraspora]WBB96700.1 hypothetical protein O7553_25965 [Solwaraspora sp. WMMA2059]WBC19396.1 hypothetical protein O7543_21405 [Solwaraspora sp. WMMA2080]WJK33021.1 hypothetical protein O7610_20155 [Solwaraspora sp. WMMA2065]
MTASPAWRYAEVLAIGLLVAYAVASGLPTPRWAVPAALAVLMLDAVRTMPGDRAEGHGWQVLRPDTAGVDRFAGVEAGLALCWASLTAVAVLVAAWHRHPRRRRPAVATALAAVVITGYAAIRIIASWLTMAINHRDHSTGADLAGSVIAVSLAVLPPLGLGLAALALATALAGHRRWLASAGAALLAVTALPHVDAAIRAVPLPLHAGDQLAWSAAYAIGSTPSTPYPVTALITLLELTAYLLLVTGLADFHPPTSTARTEADQSRR